MVGEKAAEEAETEATSSKPVKTRAEKDVHNARCVNYREKIKARTSIKVGAPKEMMGKSAAEEAGTEATNPHKQTATGSKPVKTRAEKDIHNARCVMYRQNVKRRREELEQVEIKYYEMVPKFEQMRGDNQRMEMELKQEKSKMRCMENEMQALRKALEKQAANEAQMRQIPTRWKVNGQNFSSFDKSIEWFASQTNVQVDQVSGTSETVFQDANELLGLVATGTDNFQPSMADFYQQMGFGNYIPPPLHQTASAAGASSSTNHGFPFEFEAPGALINSSAGSSFGANHDLPAPNNHDNLFTHPAAGVLTNSDAGSSFGENHNPPIGFDATNNHDNNRDLFTQGPFAGFRF
ncbi:hypothetical protein REPUB_Repub08aG0161500 [Reevesia pubescens]